MNLVEKFKNSSYQYEGANVKLFGRLSQDCSREELYCMLGYLMNNQIGIFPLVSNFTEKQALEKIAEKLGYNIIFKET